MIPSESAAFVIRVRPGSNPLAKVMAVLHQRHTEITHLHYDANEGDAVLTVSVCVPSGRSSHIREALARVIDVSSVHRRDGSAVEDG